MAKILKKITVKGVCGEIEKPEKEIGLMTVYGLANSGTPDSSQYGDYVRFNGQFEAVDHKTGELFQSGTMIIPGIGEVLLYGALSNIGEDGGSLRFAFEFGIKPSKSPTGYDYTLKPLTESNASDPLADLRAQLKLPANAKLPELAAPAPTDTGHSKAKAKA